MQKESDKHECYPLHMDRLPEYFYQKTRKELNETPETREVELKKLKDFLSAHEISTGIEFEEDFLYRFLRYTKYDSLKAFHYLQKYLAFRRNHSSVFQTIPDEYFSTNPSTEIISVLPYRCPDGCAIILTQLGKWNPKEFSLECIKSESIAAFLQPLRCPMTQISGFKIIHDFKDTVKFMRYCTLQNILFAFNASFGCIPARYKEFHVINESLIMAFIWSALKLAMTEKMKKRFFFHSKPEDLLKHFPKSIIPAQYGGTLVNYHDTELMRKFNKDHGNCPEGGQRNYY